MNRDDFLDKINNIPYWVKNKEDALKFAMHLNYRLEQSKAIIDVMTTTQKKYLSQKIHEEILNEIDEICLIFDKWYQSMIDEIPKNEQTEK